MRIVEKPRAIPAPCSALAPSRTDTFRNLRQARPAQPVNLQFCGFQAADLGDRWRLTLPDRL